MVIGPLLCHSNPMTTARVFLTHCLIWLLTLASPAGAGHFVTTDPQEGIAQSIFAGLQDGAPERQPGQTDDEYYAVYNAWKNDIAGQAKLLGAVVGYTTSGGQAVNVSNAASIAESGSRYNYLNHTELQQARDLFEEREELEDEIRRLTSYCIFCNVQEVLAIRAKLDAIAMEIAALQVASASNTLDMVNACAAGNTVECQAHRQAAANYLENTNGWFGMEARLATVFDVSAGALDGVEVDWGGNLDAWLTEQYDIAQANPNADWGSIEGIVADHAIMRDGIINVGVGTAAIGVAAIGCIGSSGLACGVIVGGAALAESNTIYDGVATVITGESQDGYIKNTLLAAGFDDAQAAQYERSIETGLVVATISVDGVLVIRNLDGVALNTGRQTVDDLAQGTGRARADRLLPEGYRVVDDSVGAQRVSPPNGYRWVADSDGNVQLQSTTNYRVYQSIDDLPESSRPVNLTPAGAGRSGAFNQAKRDAGIPTSQQPIEVLPNFDR